MERIFNPQRIVVVGVSERPDNLARNILANLRAFGYQGELHAVGRRGGEVHGVPIVSSLDEVPDGLDLAVILVPAPLVPGLVETCGRKGILRVIVESGGFSEFSEEGRRLEEQLVEIIRRWGIRLVGPNCISVINLEDGVCLPFARLSPQVVQLGSASAIAQSGGISITYTGMLSLSGVGINKAISIGNKIDLDEVDYLAYLLEDPGTESICLYLESIAKGRELMELARTAKKPIIAHKANRGQASQGIALSHTAALANDDRIVSAAFRQVGILRAESFRDTAAMAQGLALPPVRGNDLVIISRSGGHAVVAADAAEQHGFRLPPLSEKLSGRVRDFFSADVIALTNPLDLGTIFDFDLYAHIVAESLRVLTPDAVLLINTYSLDEMDAARRMARRVEELVRETGCPVALCVYAEGAESRTIQKALDMPVFTTIEGALRGLAASRDWHVRQAREDTAPALLPLPARKREGERLEPGVMTTDRALALCRAYDIPVVPFEVAQAPGDAVEAAGRVGYPVALKLLAPGIVHKSDVGGVALGLGDAEGVRQAAEGMLARVDGPAGLLVQRMAEPGVEVIVGGKRDPSFGPVIMFGLGGIYVEVFDDVAFRMAPVGRADAQGMIGEVRGSRLLEGMRGAPPVDRAALVDALQAVSRLLVEHPEVQELDINPLLASASGVVAVDARAVVSHASLNVGGMVE
jgi:acetyltransferase